MPSFVAVFRFDCIVASLKQTVLNRNKTVRRSTTRLPFDNHYYYYYSSTTTTNRSPDVVVIHLLRLFVSTLARGAIEVSQSPQKIIDPKPQSRSPFTFGLPRQTLDAKSARGKKEWADFTCWKKEERKIRDRAKEAIFVCT